MDTSIQTWHFHGCYYDATKHWTNWGLQNSEQTLGGPGYLGNFNLELRRERSTKIKYKLFMSTVGPLAVLGICIPGANIFGRGKKLW